MHAIAAIAHKGERPEAYCHHWLTMEAYRATYQYIVEPSRGEEYWAKTDYLPPLPPQLKKKKLGRPRKNRRKDATEESSSRKQHKVKRKLSEFTCTRCGGSGHNRQGCPLL